MAENSKRFLIISNQVNLNVFPTYSTKFRFVITKHMIKSPIQFVYAVVSDFFSFRMHSIVHFAHFVFKWCRKQIFLLRLFVGFVDYKFKFCCEFCYLAYSAFFSDHPPGLLRSPNNGGHILRRFLASHFRQVISKCSPTMVDSSP